MERHGMKRKAFLFPGTVSPHLRSFPPPISAREKWREKCLQSEKLPHRPTSETRKLKRAVNQIDLCYTGGISDKETLICFEGFPGGSHGKEFTCSAGNLGSTPGLGGSPGGGHGSPPQCSCLENPCGERSLADYSACGRKESDTTELLSTAQNLF